MNLDTNNEEVWMGASSSSHLFIFKLRQEAWITHRASSTSRSKKKNRKISNKTNKNDNTLEETEKKNGNVKTELGGHR